MAVLILLSKHIFSQSINTVNLIKGSEKPIKIEYKKSKIITYQEYTIIINESESEIGEKVVLLNKRSGKNSLITNYDEECIFVGLHKNQLFFSCGTDVIRGFYIYNISSASKWEIEEGVLSASINGNKLSIESKVSEERIKKYKLIDRECNTQICAYYENINYNLDTKQKQYLGNFTWKE
jgi:hypothetical protein